MGTSIALPAITRRIATGTALIVVYPGKALVSQCYYHSLNIKLFEFEMAHKDHISEEMESELVIIYLLPSLQTI